MLLLTRQDVHSHYNKVLPSASYQEQPTFFTSVQAQNIKVFLGKLHVLHLSKVCQMVACKSGSLSKIYSITNFLPKIMVICYKNGIA